MTFVFPYLFPISPSFIASERLCFVIVAFPWHFHIFLSSFEASKFIQFFQFRVDPFFRRKAKNVYQCALTLAMLNKLRRHAHFKFSANQIT